MTLQEAIAAAEVLLPGRAAPDGRIDPRWQAIIAIREFIETEIRRRDQRSRVVCVETGDAKEGVVLSPALVDCCECAGTGQA
jgi:hypothetical protein